MFKVPFAGSDSGNDGGMGCATNVSIATPACWTQERGSTQGGAQEGIMREVREVGRCTEPGGKKVDSPTRTPTKSVNSSLCCAFAADADLHGVVCAPWVWTSSALCFSAVGRCCAVVVGVGQEVGGETHISDRERKTSNNTPKRIARR